MVAMLLMENPWQRMTHGSAEKLDKIEEDQKERHVDNNGSEQLGVTTKKRLWKIRTHGSADCV